MIFTTCRVMLGVRRLLITILFSLVFCSAKKGNFQPRLDYSSQAELFEVAREIEVLAPSHFPKPTRMLNDTAVPIVEPTFGKHRADQDVVMVSCGSYCSCVAAKTAGAKRLRRP